MEMKKSIVCNLFTCTDKHNETSYAYMYVMIYVGCTGIAPQKKNDLSILYRISILILMSLDPISHYIILYISVKMQRMGERCW